MQVVAFIKGTRTQPECGFSYKVLTMLNQARTNYEVVNVLDEQFNPGLREAIKTYSQWPTIPQVSPAGFARLHGTLSVHLFEARHACYVWPMRQRQLYLPVSAVCLI